MKDGLTKRKRFTEEQIITVLREHEAGAKAGDLARKHGISEATLYNWKAKYGGMDVSDAKRLKALEDENAKLLADQMLQASATARASFKKMVGPAAKREAVAHLQAVMGVSERRACSFVGADRKMVRYRSRRPPETELRKVTRPRQRAPPLRLSTPVHSAPARGRAIRGQSHLPALPRGGPDGAQAPGTATSGRHAGADSG